MTVSPGSAAFGALLRRLRTERGLSQNALSRAAGVDPSYVNRLERTGPDGNGAAPGARTLPSRPIITALALALDLSYAERDRFLYAAGLAPEVDWQARCEEAEARLALVRDAVGGDRSQEGASRS